MHGAAPQPGRRPGRRGGVGDPQPRLRVARRQRRRARRLDERLLAAPAVPAAGVQPEGAEPGPAHLGRRGEQGGGQPGLHFIIEGGRPGPLAQLGQQPFGVRRPHPHLDAAATRRRRRRRHQPPGAFAADHHGGVQEIDAGLGAPVRGDGEVGDPQAGDATARGRHGRLGLRVYLGTPKINRNREAGKLFCPPQARQPFKPGVLTHIHTYRMVSHMKAKTTLSIDASVMARLKQEAARQGRTMSELVETALRRLLHSRDVEPDLPPLPTFDSGGHLVDIADRDALYQAMEGR